MDSTQLIWDTRTHKWLSPVPPVITLYERDLKITCSVAPFQVKGKDPQGNEIYIRSRHGQWRIDLNEKTKLEGYEEPLSLEDLVFYARGRLSIIWGK